MPLADLAKTVDTKASALARNLGDAVEVIGALTVPSGVLELKEHPNRKSSLLYKILFVSNNVHILNATRDVCAGCAELAI